MSREPKAELDPRNPDHNLSRQQRLNPLTSETHPKANF